MNIQDAINSGRRHRLPGTFWYPAAHPSYGDFAYPSSAIIRSDWEIEERPSEVTRVTLYSALCKVLGHPPKGDLNNKGFNELCAELGLDP